MNGSVLRSGGAVIVRPRLWGTALVQWVRLVRRGWWRRPPFLPVVDEVYLRFRAETAYGDPDHAVEAADLVSYLEWCRSVARSR